LSGSNIISTALEGRVVRWYVCRRIEVVLLVLALLTTELLSECRLVGLAINAIVGVLLLFLGNLVVSTPIPINILTVLICAIGGVLGWLIIVILYLLRIAFYVPL
jgi:hypothetical protein